MRTSRPRPVIVKLIAVVGLVCSFCSVSAQEAIPEMDQVLSWLPPSIEVVLGARPPVNIQEVDGWDELRERSKRDKRCVLTVFNAAFLFARDCAGDRENPNSDCDIEGGVEFAVEGSKGFETPVGFNMTTFQFCEIVCYSNTEPCIRKLEEYMSHARPERRINLHECEVLVFGADDQKVHSASTSYVSRVSSTVLVISNDLGLLEETLYRRSSNASKWFGEELGFEIDKSRPAWGVRFFKKAVKPSRDWSSPLNPQCSGIGADDMAASASFELIGKNPLIIRVTYRSDAPDVKKLSQIPWLRWSKIITREVRERENGLIQIELGCPEEAYNVLSEGERFFALNTILLFIMGHGFAI